MGKPSSESSDHDNKGLESPNLNAFVQSNVAKLRQLYNYAQSNACGMNYRNYNST